MLPMELNNLNEIPIVNDESSLPFWSWNNDLDIEELKKQIHFIKESGHGGFIMHARKGLKTEYLGKKWFACVRECIKLADELGLSAYVYDENGWPSGFVGGKMLREGNYAHYLDLQERNDYDETALSVFVRVENRFVRVKKAGEYSCYYCIYDREDKSFTDILNPKVTETFINETYLPYCIQFQNDCGKAFKGFFTDEPQFYRYRTPYSPVLKDGFYKEYNQDICNELIYLFNQEEQGYLFRTKYYRLLNKLYIENYIKKIYEFCENYNLEITGHTVEENSLYSQMWGCAGAMPFYEWEHIIGVDWLCRMIGSEMNPKQASSIAQQLGKKRVMAEAFAACGHDVTPMELKWITEFLYANGVNMLCPHLFAYSLSGQGKTDHPPTFSKHNTWSEYYSKFFHYFSKLGYILANTTEIADTLVIHPMNNIYLMYERDKDYESVKDFEEKFLCLIKKLNQNQVLHHYGWEPLLNKYARVEGSELVVGQCRYKNIIVPEMLSLNCSTVKLLHEFAEAGGKIYYENPEALEYIDGSPCIFSKESTISLEEIVQKGEIRQKNISENIQCVLRKDEKDNVMLYCVNHSKDSREENEISLSVHDILEYDLIRNIYRQTDSRYQNGQIILKLSLRPMESRLFVLNCQDKISDKIYPKKVYFDQEKVITQTFIMRKPQQNYLILDRAAISREGQFYETEKPLPCICEELIKGQSFGGDGKQSYCGKLFIKHKFRVDVLPSNLSLRREKMKYLNYYVNGHLVADFCQSDFDCNFEEADILAYVCVGQNEIVYEIEYYQNKDVKRILFENNDAESLKNCLVYDTEIENLYLIGDFQVSFTEEFERTKNHGIKYSGIPYITKKTIKGISPVLSGYPFYAGKVVYETEIEFPKNSQLQLEGRFCAADVYINDVKTDNLFFNHVSDIPADFYGKKVNLKICVTVSLRNLMGPHHAKEAESFVEVPNRFTMQGTWQNSQSILYTPNYNFVDVGLKSVKILTNK